MGRWSGALSDSALADSPNLFSYMFRDFQRVPGFDFEVIPGFPKVKSLRYVQKSYRCCVFLRVLFVWRVAFMFVLFVFVGRKGVKGTKT